MIPKKHRTRWLAALCLLSATLFNPYLGYAQSDYLSIFGDAGCNEHNRITTAITPSTSSFLGMGSQNDPDYLTAASTHYFKNSLYNRSGDLLFSVNANGIYAPSGNRVHRINYGLDITKYPPVGLPYNDYFDARYSCSEMVIFPVPCQTNSYYVMFWSTLGSGDPSGFFGHQTPRVLRLIRVDIIADVFGTAATESDWYHITDQLINPPTYGSPNNPYIYTNYSPVEIVADRANPDGSRDIYTIHEGYVSDFYPHIRYYGQIQKWTFSAGGTIPVTPTSVFATTSYTADLTMRTYSTKTKIFRVPSGTPGVTHRLIAYVGKDDVNHGSFLQTYNIDNGDMNLYKAPPNSGSVDGDRDINGFEYMPEYDAFYFAYDDVTNPASASGGLGYALRSTVAGTSTDITPISSTLDYRGSDLERTKNGDILLVHLNTSTSTEELAYLPAASLSASFTTTTPTIPTVSCAAGTYNISVNNHQSSESTFSGVDVTSSYLGSQIRDENYSSWGFDLSTIVVISDAQTWTPTNNPVKNATGLSSVAEISSVGIVILPGGSLTIQNMTVKMAKNSIIDVRPSTSAANGGRLYLDNTKLTVGPVICDAAGTMWGGVRVSGNPALSQGTLSSSKQGGVKMINNSEISYAHIGIAAGFYYRKRINTGMFWISYPAWDNGGGIVEATTGSTFINNNVGVQFAPYLPAANNISYFRDCNFKINDNNVIVSADMRHAYLSNVKGVKFLGCNFENGTSTTKYTYGIYAQDAGFVVNRASLFPLSPCQFSNLYNGIYQATSTGTRTVAVYNSEFNNNRTGIRLAGTQAPVVVDNVFRVPYLTSGSSLFPFATPVSIQSVGINLEAANYYVVHNNSFNFSWGSNPYIPWGGINRTVGIIANNTGRNDNLINSNSFKGLGVGNLANYANRKNLEGLWFGCNTNNNNMQDIAVKGLTNTTVSQNDRDGINTYQGFPVGTASHPSGLPAGNIFSSGSSVVNINVDVSGAEPVDYRYSNPSYGGVPLNKPGEFGVTGSVMGTTVIMMDLPNKCKLDDLYGSGDEHTGPRPFVINTNWDAHIQRIGKLENVNYYMLNDTGVTHRDSLYYWLGEIGSPQTTMLSAYLLLEDSLVDSAYNMYTSIPSKYAFTSRDSVEFVTNGQVPFDIELAKTIRSGASTTLLTSLAAHLDTLTDSAFVADIAGYATAEFLEMPNSWPRTKIETILQGLAPDLYDSVIVVSPDTLLYPDLDTTFVPEIDKGVLAVTELSQGPVAGCQYAELLVSNCIESSSPYVDVRGWRIDDYSGFLTECAPQNVNPGNLRLAYDDVWEHVTVGSIIMLYNADNNCYGLPDTFTIDTFAGKYYIPIGSAKYNHVDQFYAVENNNACNYCSDSGTTVYDSFTTWSGVFIDSVFDCIQVICPGCTAENPTSPKMYFGAGYYPVEYDQKWVPETPGAKSVGVVVVPNFDFTGRYKYVYTGSDAAHLLHPDNWDVLPADAAGTIPATFGNVNEDFYNAVINHESGMPCCAVYVPEQQQAMRPGADDGGTVTEKAAVIQGLKVYPNPANSVLNFDFPASRETVIRITDVAGRVVHRQTVKDAGHTTVNVKGYVPGIYTWHITTSAGTQTGKVVIME